MNTVTIPYPPEVRQALQQEPDEFEAEARLLLAVKLYEIGRLSTGLAARLAGVPRGEFIFLLKRYNLSPFGENPDELEDDLASASFYRNVVGSCIERVLARPTPGVQTPD